MPRESVCDGLIFPMKGSTGQVFNTSLEEGVVKVFMKNT